MTQATALAFPEENLVGWERALCAFLVEKQRRSGSLRTVQGYSSMLQDFFGRVPKPPDKVTVQEVFPWEGQPLSRSIVFSCLLLKRPAPRVTKTKTMLPRALLLDADVVRCMLRSEPVQRCNLVDGLPVVLP
jgi:hypothetical protein